MGQRGIMKKLAILLLSQLLCFQAFAWRESNGGNGVEAEAKKIANELLIEMWRIPILRVYYQPSDYEIIKGKNLKLKTGYVDAYTVTDTFNSQSLIFIDEVKWANLNEDQKRYLLLHELTHIMFFVDKDYDFSQIAIQKMQKYNQLSRKYPQSEYPFEVEMISAVKECKLSSFITSYLLVGDLNYKMNTTNETIQELVLKSDCNEIKNYAPLKALMGLTL